MKEGSPLQFRRGVGGEEKTRSTSLNNHTSNPMKEGFPLHLERACPENREAGGGVEITKHHKMKT